ncbi:MAG: HDOD domain-containing protein [Pseudomonadota bacterium]
MLQRHHVPSGSYFVGPHRPILLQAFLGTCVAVAVFDRKAGVGGLSHLLLPEPVSLESTFQREKYASVGLPLFINALYAAGAQKEDLIAWVGGGALVGPVSQRDLDLDIGGRTAEIARQLLAREGIKVAHAETGGVFSCCMSLNMQSWECRIDPVGADKAGSHISIPPPHEKEIKSSIERLQPIPQVALKILRLMGNDEFDVIGIADEVRQDQVISAMTLKLCNSALYARRNPIDSLDHALIYLGKDIFLRLVISAAVSGLFENTGSGYSLSKGGLYHHAVGTALIAEKLAGVTGLVAPAIAYTAGLLHDIGKVVLDQYVTSAYPLLYRNVHEGDTSFQDIERQQFGVDHTDIGCTLGQLWGFPDSLMTTIRHHHCPEAADRHTKLVHIVYLADLLMSRFNTGLELERVSTQALTERLHVIGFSPDRFQEIVEIIPDGAFTFETEQNTE